MSTFLKLLGFVALGVAVLVVGGIVLGMVTAVLKMLVPIAILAAIGYVVFRVMAGGGAPPQPDADRRAIGPSQEPKQERKGLSDEEAAKRFEELKKGPH